MYFRGVGVAENTRFSPHSKHSNTNKNNNINNNRNDGARPYSARSQENDKGNNNGSRPCPARGRNSARGHEHNKSNTNKMDYMEVTTTTVQSKLPCTAQGRGGSRPRQWL